MSPPSEPGLVRLNGLLAEIAVLAAESAFRLRRLDAMVSQSAGAADASGLQVFIRHELGAEEAAIVERGRLMDLCARALQ